MNYEFFKGPIVLNQQETIDIQKGFHLQYFDFTNQFYLTEPQVIELLDRFSGIPSISYACLFSAVNSYVYGNCGGTDEMDVQSVMSWMYLATRSRSFKVLDFVDDVQNMVNIENLFHYISATETIVPHQWVSDVQKSVDPLMWKVLMNRHDFAVDLNATMEQAQAFPIEIEEKAKDFISKSSGNIDDILGDMNISSK